MDKHFAANVCMYAETFVYFSFKVTIYLNFQIIDCAFYR